MFVADLTPLPKGDGVLAIGWLDADHAHTTGAVPHAFIEALFDACVLKQIRMTRGWHQCALCGPGAAYPIVETWSGRSCSLGHSEIEPIGRDGIHYAAPQLIFHYVVRHQYQPPAAFVEAVLRGEFAEDVWFLVKNLEPIEGQLGQELKRGLTRRLELADDMADRIDLQAAVGTIIRSFTDSAIEDARVLYVARRAIEVAWDGSAGTGLAILSSFCESHELSFDEHWAQWRRRQRHR